MDERAERTRSRQTKWWIAASICALQIFPGYGKIAQYLQTTVAHLPRTDWPDSAIAYLPARLIVEPSIVVLERILPQDSLWVADQQRALARWYVEADGDSLAIAAPLVARSLTTLERVASQDCNQYCRQIVEGHYYWVPIDYINEDDISLAERSIRLKILAEDKEDWFIAGEMYYIAQLYEDIEDFETSRRHFETAKRYSVPRLGDRPPGLQLSDSQTAVRQPPA